MTEEFKDRFVQALYDKNEGNQSELARYAHVSPQAVQKWIERNSPPKGKTLDLVCEFLGVQQAWLVFGAPKTEPPLKPVPVVQLAYVMPDEQTLLTNYRESTDTGKRQLLLSSTKTEKLPASALPAKHTRHQP